MAVATWFVALLVLGAAVLMLLAARRPAYECESVTYIYSFEKDDPQRHEQTIRMKLRAGQDDVAFVKNRYYWTGRGKDARS